jgi:enoyl-CoA hydratase/carnithine racemase
MPLVRHAITAGVATVTLDDPDRRNALTLPMVNEICACSTSSRRTRRWGRW